MAITEQPGSFAVRKNASRLLLFTVKDENGDAVNLSSGFTFVFTWLLETRLGEVVEFTTTAAVLTAPANPTNGIIGIKIDDTTAASAAPGVYPFRFDAVESGSPFGNYPAVHGNGTLLAEI